MSTIWCRLEVEGVPSYALVDGAVARVLDAAPYLGGRPTGLALPMAGAKLLVPTEPRNFFAVGINYHEHIEWANRHHGLSLKVPQQADVGERFASALTATGTDVILPPDSAGSFEFEGELVAVIGKEARNVKEEDALDFVAGYTLGNDLSERAWQFADRTLWRAKSSATFKPMGPMVVGGIDPMDQQIDVLVNGAQVSSYSTKGMIFDVRHYISRISRYLPLFPGDVIWFGCDGPTLPGLSSGDTVAVRNSAIGALRNKIVRAPKEA